MGTEQPTRIRDQLDYKLVFDHMPGMCLVLDPGFVIVAQNAEHARLTLSANKQVVARACSNTSPNRFSAL